MFTVHPLNDNRSFFYNLFQFLSFHLNGRSATTTASLTFEVLNTGTYAYNNQYNQYPCNNENRHLIQPLYLYC